MTTQTLIGRSDSAAVATNKVLRNTYAMLGLTMIPTVIGAMIGINLNFAWMMATSPIIMFVGIFAAVFGMTWLISKNANNAAGVWLLFWALLSLWVYC